MKASDDLHTLIKSLSKNEKGYFKKLSSAYSNNGTNNYVRLFDAIEKQKGYDEAAIKNKFKGETFIKQLHVTKNYLYSLILDNLSAYHTSNDLKLHKLLSHIEVLFNKGLFAQCEKILQRAKDLAVKYERFNILISIYDWERKVIKHTDDYKRIENYLDTEYAAIQNNLDLLKEEYYFDELQVGIFFLQRNERYIRSEKELSRYKELINHPLMKNEKNARSFNARNSYYLGNAFYNLSKGNLEKSYAYRKSALEQWKNNPHFIEDNGWGYIRVLINFAIVNIELKKYDEALVYLKQASEVKITNPLVIKDITLTIYAYRLDVYYKSGQYEKGYAMLAEIKNKVLEYGATPNSKRTFALFIYAAFLCFSTNHNTAALWWLNSILNDTRKDIFDQELSFARILHLMIHYELGNELLLESAVKSTYRFLYKRDKLYKFEKLVLDFIQKSFRITSQKELKAEAQTLKRAITGLYKDPQEKRIVELFMLDKWLDKKF